jgi:hypothetical protein
MVESVEVEVFFLSVAAHAMRALQIATACDLDT